MWISREVAEDIESLLNPDKIVILFGPRQVGKTSLVRRITNDNDEVVWLNCDEPDIRRLLTEITSSQLRRLVGSAKTVVIDEGQRVKNIGLTLKLIVDNLQPITLLVTGSSSFDLANEIKEPLTGRKWEFLLLPFSTGEMVHYHGEIEEKRLLPARLIYGMYPEVIKNPGNEERILRELSGSYLYKDIFAFQDVRKPDVIEKLLQAIALQVCNEVSYNELSQLLGIDIATVQRYIYLLEESYVIFRLTSYSRNLRNELKKSRKFYFYDNGIRNAILNDFQVHDLRSDKGALWENFLVSERFKYLNNRNLPARNYFWRTTQQQEIDYLEVKNNTINAYEFKWNPGRRVLFSKTFLNAYENVTTAVVNTENYMDFLVERL